MMALFGRWRRGGGAGGAPAFAEAKAATVALTSLPNRTPVYPSGAFIPLANHTYRKNELIFRGMNLIIGGVMEAPLSVIDADNNDVEGHPLAELMRRPNPAMSAGQLWRKTILHLYLAGDAYWLKVRNGIGIAELWPLRPDRVNVVTDDFGLIAGYQYQIKGARQPLALEDIVRFHFEDPIDDYAGFPPLMAALVRAAIDNEASDMMKSLLQNYAIPPMVVTTQANIDQPLVDRLRQMWRSAFGGKNRGMPAFMQAGMDVKAIGLTMKDLTFPELDASSQKRVLVAIGVPPVLLGQEATFANYEQARQSFYEDTVEPLQSELADVIGYSLLRADFDRGGTLAAWFDTSEVSALRPARMARATIAREAFQAGASLQNEYRAEIGLPPVEGGDIYLRTIAQMAVSVGEPAPAPMTGQQPALQDQQNPNSPPAAQGAGARTLAERKAGKLTARERVALAVTKRIILGRNRIADAWFLKLKSWARGEFAREALEVRSAISVRRKAFSFDEEQRILAELASLEADWARRSQQQVVGIMSGLAGVSAQNAGADLGIAFDLNNPAVLQFVRDYSFKFAQKISSESARQVREIMAAGQRDGLSVSEIADRFTDKFAQWDSLRAELVARSETIRAANAGAMESYKQAGITRKTWLSSDDPCPYCQALDGKTVGIEENFLELNASFQPDGAAHPLRITYEEVGAPPAHVNCRCAIGAEVES